MSEILKPFFTTKPRGTGMGLPLVRYLIKQAGGILTVKSEYSNGTNFDIYFPGVIENR